MTLFHKILTRIASLLKVLTFEWDLLNPHPPSLPSFVPRSFYRTNAPSPPRLIRIEILLFVLIWNSYLFWFYFWICINLNLILVFVFVIKLPKLVPWLFFSSRFQFWTSDFHQIRCKCPSSALVFFSETKSF